MVTDTKRVESDLPIPPGEVLAEELAARGMRQKELALLMKRPEQAISEIINAKKAITPETALQLEQVLEISAGFWLGLQATYGLTLARLRNDERRLGTTRARRLTRTPTRRRR